MEGGGRKFWQITRDFAKTFLSKIFLPIKVGMCSYRTKLWFEPEQHYSVWLPQCMPRLQVACGSNHHGAEIFFSIQIAYVIVKIVNPCFNRPSLLSSSLVG